MMANFIKLCSNYNASQPPQFLFTRARLGRTIYQTYQLKTSDNCEVTSMLFDGPMRFRGHWMCIK